jgi:hypothetical protein
MALRMTCPTKRKGSENWYYRRRIPADVQAILAGMPKSRQPRNWSASEINISLRTADREVAKAKFAAVAAAVEKTLAALRAGPQPLKPHDDTAGVATHINTRMAPMNDTRAYGIRWEDMAQEEYRRGYAEGLAGVPYLTRSLASSQSDGRAVSRLLCRSLVSARGR